MFRLRDYRVDKGVYLLGDNRSELIYDSREFGEVDPETLPRAGHPAPAACAERATTTSSHGYLDLIE